MPHAYARLIHRFRWLVVAVWLAAVVASTIWLPSLASVVAQHSSTFLPANASVNTAQQWLNRIDPGQASASSAVIAIHSPHRLTAAQRDFFRARLAYIDAHKSLYGIRSLQDPFNTPAALATSFRSTDGTTEVALVGLPRSDMAKSTRTAITRLQAEFKTVPSGLRVYLTGDAPIQQQELQISQAGVKKTAAVTVALVLIILLLVFRSLLAPLMTLIAIGLSFTISSGIVAWLAQHGLPSSTFTQTFLIAVLFGAGTDYSIIMLNRFREELTRTHDITDALSQSLGAVAKTMVFSASTVLLSFAVLYFARFGLYRSAVGVSVGVGVTLLACLSLVPSLMAIFGRSLYWPRRPVAGAAHNPSRLWSFTGGLAVRRPWLMLLALAVVLAPLALQFTDRRTFDPLSDIPDASSAVGFNIVANAFGAGHVLPMQLVLRTPGNLRTPRGLATVARISSAVASLPAVAEVMSAAAPAGKPIAGLTLAAQNRQAAAGLAKVGGGLGRLADGLSRSGASLASGAAQVQALDHGAQRLSGGLHRLSAGSASLEQNGGRLTQAAQQVSHGSAALAGAVTRLHLGAGQASQGSVKLATGAGRTAAGAASLAKGAGRLQQSQQQLGKLARTLANALAAWTKAHPADAANPQWRQIVGMARAESAGSAKLSAAGASLATGARTLSVGAAGLDAGATRLAGGMQKLASGTQQAQAGASSLASGAGALASGAGRLASGSAALSRASDRLSAGGDQVARGVSALTAQYGPLASGLAKAGQGAHSLLSGTQKVHGFLSGSASAASQGNPGFYVPADVIRHNASLKKALTNYVSADGHTAKFTVLLNDNAFSMKAINSLPGIMQAARLALHNGPSPAGSILAAGTTPTQAALNTISSQDFTHAVLLITLTIFLLLAVMLRSLITPLYILASLVGTYFVTMGILQRIAQDVMHKTGLSWTVPFFTFLLLVALGVDYSIFLLSRFEEELRDGNHQSPAQAMRRAMGLMGNVILSAAVIMAGTFGSLTVTGVTSLVEIGVAVVIGLLLYTTVILALFIPAASAVVGAGHFWPFFATDAPPADKHTAPGGAGPANGVASE